MIIYIYGYVVIYPYTYIYAMYVLYIYLSSTNQGPLSPRAVKRARIEAIELHKVGAVGASDVIQLGITWTYLLLKNGDLTTINGDLIVSFNGE